MASNAQINFKALFGIVRFSAIVDSGVVARGGDRRAPLYILGCRKIVVKYFCSKMRNFELKTYISEKSEKKLKL